MSKELECLDRIDKRNYLTEREHKEFLGVVEKALTEYEAIKKSEPSEALECLEKVYSRLPQWDLSRNIDQYNTIKQALLKAQEPKQYVDELKLVEKKLKALEIIKEKECDVSWLKYCIKENLIVEAYNSGYPEYHKKLTEEEFNLLKEVLE